MSKKVYEAYAVVVGEMCIRDRAERVWVEEQAMIGSEIIGRFRRLIWERLQRPDTGRY